MPIEQNLECDINETLQITDLVTVDGTRYSTPVNITGWTLQTVIHKLLGDGIPIKTYTPNIPVGTDGKAITTIPNSDILLLGVGDFRWYTARTDSGAEANLTKGTFTIKPI